MSLNLVIPIWKPKGYTSFDIVKKVRRIVRIKKVGHAGTLDPFAEGILIVCTGKKTSHIEKYMNQIKEYTGIINLGSRTATLDPESEVDKLKEFKEVTAKELDIVKKEFIGCIDQIPPQFSAIKHNGTPIYKYARKNIRIELKPRKVNIYNFIINKYQNKKIKFTISCGRGTYIRSIARDFGEKLNTYGYLLELQRTKIGKFNITNTIKLEKVEEWLSTKI